MKKVKNDFKEKWWNKVLELIGINTLLGNITKENSFDQRGFYIGDHAYSTLVSICKWTKVIFLFSKHASNKLNASSNFQD